MASKRYKKLLKKIKELELKPEPIEKLLPEIKNNCTTKFDESLDLSFQINNKQKKSEVNIRTVVNLPGGTGKSIKVAVVCEDSKAQEAKDAGADIVGSDEFIEKIKNGELNFEKLISTPGMMIKLSKLGKVLGPKGLMPNPKLGSVSENIKEAVTNAKSGQAEIRNDKDGNIGVSIGKKSFHDDQLLKNFHAILDALEKEKSNNTLKGDLIKNTFVTSSMGVSYKVKLGKLI
jgi:large subunit ribosomal protein L1